MNAYDRFLAEREKALAEGDEDFTKPGLGAGDELTTAEFIAARNRANPAAADDGKELTSVNEAQAKRAAEKAAKEAAKKAEREAKKNGGKSGGEFEPA